MKLLLKLFKGPIKRYIRRELRKESNRILAIDAINTKLDIPKISEEDEAKMISSVLDAAIECVDISLESL